MILANGIGGALLLGGLLVGLLSLVVAVVIETPVLRLWWRRKSVWRWVLGANIASLAVGILPAILWNITPSPGEGVDPWEWHQTVAGKVLLFTGAVFVMTVLVEGAVYVWMNRKVGPSLPMRRIAIATLTANAISYVPMIVYLVTQARSTGDFELLPDATWVAADDTRVYFVDQASNKLHSMRLDGSDRQLELSETLGRFEGEVEYTAFYALLDDDPRILFVAPDRYWHVFDGESDRRLSIALPDHHGRAHPGDVAISLHEALAEIGITQPLPTGDQSLDGVYLSSSTRFDWTRKSRTLKAYRIASGMTPYSGAGLGLTFWSEDVPKTLTFRVWAGFLSLACNNPAVLPDENTVVFRCGDSIMVMDFAKRRVGCLVRGDSLALKLPQFSEGDWRVYAREDATAEPIDANEAAPAGTTQPTIGNVTSIEAAEETIHQARRAGIDYRRVLRRAERGDADALAQLMAVSTETDAAGALGHLYVLNELLNAVGDANFAEVAQQQPLEVKEVVLRFLEGAVLEHWQGDPQRSIPTAFPRTYQALSEDKEEGVRFKAEVVSIEPLASFSGTFLPVAVDPRFVMTIEPLDDVPATAWMTSQHYHLGIHSVALLFTNDEPAGQVFEFRLYGSRSDGYYHIELLDTVAP